ncbi:GNAT family N-acetyltransferase [Desulfosporosinus sp. OT]|uniref:GNAT family N-acetyltransferase n=1 Tax=Desulfosporosinus sp. OT TaxID=913865 RepID=UPI000319965C|nr:GNAT family N-acetyltransferase [Desulfosporosinus sp. OT]
MNVEKATISDAQEILTLQKLAYMSEAKIYNDFAIQPLNQTLNEIEREFEKKVVLKVVTDGKIIGSVRGFCEERTCYIEKLFVNPDFQGHGFGTKLMEEIESIFYNCDRFELFTGHKSLNNLRLYTKLGYKEFKTINVASELYFIFLEKNLNS